MCGIVGMAYIDEPVNAALYESLGLLQHRGQDAAGITTTDGRNIFTRKAIGLVRDVFRSEHMLRLAGTMGIGHVRYPTAGSSASSAEAQPFYVNSPYGIALAHNGNLTNAEELAEALYRTDLRHINTASDSEILLNVVAHELQNRCDSPELSADALFSALEAVYRRLRGGYAVVGLIAGRGIFAFRDPNGIRPAMLGRRQGARGDDWMVASESVAIEALGFTVVRDLAPGEAVYIDHKGQFSSRQCALPAKFTPCMFEYVYFARPDSVIDGLSVYAARINMGVKLAEKIRRDWGDHDIDVVIPVPESSRPAALELSVHLGLQYREGFVKNRYVGRTFIMPGQTLRKKSVRQKLSVIGTEFSGKNVLLVDDSIVRGTTSEQIVQMAREAGAKKVYLASAAPPVRYPNVYGIDMPAVSELIAHQRSDAQIGEMIGADRMIYQDLPDLIDSVRQSGQGPTEFENGCFDACYVTGDVSEQYLAALQSKREELGHGRRSDQAQ